MQTPELIQCNPSLKTNIDLTLLDRPALPLYDCLIILNNNIQNWLLQVLTHRARYVIASDGGANHLFNSPLRNIPHLHSIVGDLDSLNPDVRNYYQLRKVTIERDDCQDTNDFEKAIILAHRLSFKTLVCLGVLGGRMDQQLCNLSAIEKYSKLLSLNFIAFGGNSLMLLVRGGEETVIRPGKACILNQVGIFSFGRARVSTHGLKWNLNREGPELEWGNFVSSSNVIVDETVSIISQKPIFFTMELDSKQIQLSKQDLPM